MKLIRSSIVLFLNIYSSVLSSAVWTTLVSFNEDFGNGIVNNRSHVHENRAPLFSFPPVITSSPFIEEDVVKEIKDFSEEDFKEHLKLSCLNDIPQSKERELIRKHDYYQYFGFLDLIRNFPDYENYIFELEATVLGPRGKARDALRYIPGFKNSYGYGPVIGQVISSHKDRYGFWEFVKKEANVVREKRKQRAAEEKRKEQAEFYRKEQEEKKKQYEHEEQVRKEKEDLERTKAEEEKVRKEHEQRRREEAEYAQVLREIEEHDAAREKKKEEKLSALEEEYSSYAHDLFERECDDEARRYYDRSSALQKTLTHKTSYEQSYELSERGYDLLSAHAVSTEEFTSHRGNHFSHHLHSEYIAELERIAILSHAHSSYEAMHSFSHLICSSALLGVEANRNESYQIAAAYLDVCHRVGNVAENFATLLEGGIDIASRFTSAITRGASQAASQYASDWKEFASECIKNPPAALVKYIRSTIDSGIALANLVLAIASDPAAHAASLVQKIIEDPEGAISDASSFLTTLFLGNKATRFATNQLATLSRITNLERQILSFCAETEEIIKPVIAPVQTIIETSKDVLQSASEFIGADGKYSLALEALAKYPTKPPKINWRHIFYTERAHGKLQGLHVKHSKNFIKENRNVVFDVTKPIDKNGIYAGKYYLKNNFKIDKKTGAIVKKYSSFFPDDWDRIKLLEKINEAYGNRIIINESGFTGITIEGIKIKFWFKKDNNKITLNSIYPDY